MKTAKPKPPDAADCAGLRGEITTRSRFHEFCVDDDAGNLKFFDAKQCGDIVAFVHSCQVPVRIRHCVYPPGNGMDVVRRVRRGMSAMGQSLKFQTWFFEGIPANELERMRKAVELNNKGLLPTIAAGLYGYKISSLKEWVIARRPAKMALQTCNVVA